MRAYREGSVSDTQETPAEAGQEQDRPLTTHALHCPWGGRVGVGPGLWLCPVSGGHVEMQAPG